MLVALRAEVQHTEVLFHSPCLTPERCGVPGCKAAVHINKLNTAASTEHKCRQKTLHRPASTTAAYSTAPAASCQAAPFDPPIK